MKTSLHCTLLLLMASWSLNAQNLVENCSYNPLARAGNDIMANYDDNGNDNNPCDNN